MKHWRCLLKRLPVAAGGVLGSFFPSEESPGLEETSTSSLPGKQGGNESVPWPCPFAALLSHVQAAQMKAAAPSAGKREPCLCTRGKRKGLSHCSSTEPTDSKEGREGTDPQPHNARANTPPFAFIHSQQKGPRCIAPRTVLRTESRDTDGPRSSWYDVPCCFLGTTRSFSCSTPDTAKTQSLYTAAVSLQDQTPLFYCYFYYLFFF